MIDKRVIRRRKRTRVKIRRSAKRPRLSVFRSNKHIYGQILDDAKGMTLIAVSDKNLAEGKKKGMKKQDLAIMVGEIIAERAKKKKIFKVVFDRGAYRFHGRVKALAEGARKGGLKF